MVTILLALCIPLTAFVVGVLTLKSVQLGLKWQIQTAKQEIPTLEVKNPIGEAIENHQLQKRTVEQENILAEWLNGVEK